MVNHRRWVLSHAVFFLNFARTVKPAGIPWSMLSSAGGIQRRGGKTMGKDVSQENRLQAAAEHLFRLMEDRWREGITLEELAAAAGYSPFHFHRLFQGLTGMTPAEWQRDRRLSAAVRELRNSRHSATRIGYDSGFSSQETFIRSFKRRYGVTPGQYRRRAMDMTTIEPKMIEMESVLLAGIPCSTDTSKDRSITGAWEEWGRLIGTIPNRKEVRAFGLELYERSSTQKGGSTRDAAFTYIAASEVEHGNDDLPEGAVFKLLPAGRYAVFTHRGSTELLNETFRFIYEEWLPSSGCTLRTLNGGGFDLEVYDERFHPTSPDSELDLYIPID